MEKCRIDTCVAASPARQTIASQLEEVDLGTTNKPRPVNVAKELPDEEKKAMVALLTDFRDVFAWSYEDMRGLDPQLYQHQIHLSADAKPIAQ